MPKLRRLSASEAVAIFQQFGFAILSQRGSHIKLRRSTNLEKRKASPFRAPGVTSFHAKRHQERPARFQSQGRRRHHSQQPREGIARRGCLMKAALLDTRLPVHALKASLVEIIET
jgi:predicted RNA binding protein YcfA (HicA-like mRNA interferase family)